MNQAPSEVRPEPARLSVIHQEPTGQVRLVEFEDRFHRVMEKRFGQRFLNYRRDWAASSRYEFTPRFPLSLDLEVNASCNLNCIMCPAGRARYRRAVADQPLMDLWLYRRLMAEARQNDLPAMTFGFLSEPLLRPDLGEMIRLARLAGVMDIRLGTNGVLLTREVSRKLIVAGLTRLEVSVDALTSETYGRIRRGGRLETVTANIQDFLSERERADSEFPVLRLSFLNLPHNRGEQEGFLEFWRGRADLFSLQEPIYFENAPISTQIKLTPGPIDPNFQCAQPNQRLIIRSNGDAFPCCSPYGLDMKAGTFRESSVKELWDGSLIDALRALHRQKHVDENRVCRHCAARSSLRAEPVEPPVSTEV